MSNLIPAIDVSASALQAERVRMEVVAANIGNAEVTRAANGQPYRRKEVVFESVVDPSQAADPSHQVSGVRVSKIIDDTRPGEKIYMPGHPHADAKGFVTFPNVNVVEEQIDGMTASRAFEADLEVIKSARQMVSRSISLAEA